MKHKALLISILVLIAFSLSSCISLSILPGGTSQSSSRSMDLGAIRVDNNASIRLQQGTYTGRLVIDANNATISGAGIGRTVIRGDVVITGNSNKVRGLTILGVVSISGNTNDLTGAELDTSKVRARGNNNRF
jgi:formylmethanofuran dehydrogenase subunit C